MNTRLNRSNSVVFLSEGGGNPGIVERIWYGTTWPHWWSWFCCSATRWFIDSEKIDIHHGCCRCCQDRDTTHFSKIIDIRFSRGSNCFIRMIRWIFCGRGIITIFANGDQTHPKLELVTFFAGSKYERMKAFHQSYGGGNVMMSV